MRYRDRGQADADPVVTAFAGVDPSQVPDGGVDGGRRPDEIIPFIRRMVSYAGMTKSG